MNEGPEYCDNEPQSDDVQVLLHGIESKLQYDFRDKIKNELLIETLTRELGKFKDIDATKQMVNEQLREEQEKLTEDLSQQLTCWPLIQKEVERNTSMVNMIKEHYAKLAAEHNSLVFSNKTSMMDIEAVFEKEKLDWAALRDEELSTETTLNEMETTIRENDNKFTQFIQNANIDEALLVKKTENLQDELKDIYAQIEDLENREENASKAIENKSSMKEEMEGSLNNLDVEKRRAEKATFEQNHSRQMSDVKMLIAERLATIEGMHLEIEEMQSKDELEVQLTLENEAKQQELLQNIQQMQVENTELLSQLENIRKSNNETVINLSTQIKFTELEIERIDHSIGRIVKEDVELLRDKAIHEELPIKEQIVSLKTQLNDLSSKLEEKNNAIREKNEHYAAILEQVNELSRINDETDNKISDLMVSFSRSTSEMNETLKELTDQHNDLKFHSKWTLSEKKQEIERHKREFENDIDEKTKENETSLELLKNKIEQLKTSLSEMQERKDRMKLEHQKQHEKYKNFLAEEESLMQEKRELLNSPVALAKDTINLPGILKCTSRTPMKHVSFPQNLNWVSSDSSVDDRVTNSNVATKSADELWEELTERKSSEK